MAIDSRQKRQSAYKILTPWFEQGVHPSGTIGQAQRQAAAWVYSGILAGVPVPSVVGGIETIIAAKGYLQTGITAEGYLQTTIRVREG